MAIKPEAEAELLETHAAMLYPAAATGLRRIAMGQRHFTAGTVELVATLEEQNIPTLGGYSPSTANAMNQNDVEGFTNPQLKSLRSVIAAQLSNNASVAAQPNAGAALRECGFQCFITRKILAPPAACQ